jgi:hypothetical protein
MALYTTAFNTNSKTPPRSVRNEWQAIEATGVVAPSIYPNIPDKADVTLVAVNSTTVPQNDPPPP